MQPVVSQPAAAPSQRRLAVAAAATMLQPIAS